MEMSPDSPLHSLIFSTRFTKSSAHHNFCFISLFRKAVTSILVSYMSKTRPRKRIKIKGHYMRVRQRTTDKGKKGTIMGRWKSNKTRKRKYRCKLGLNDKSRVLCGFKKAGSHCLRRGSLGKRCPQLVISYH